MSVVGGRVDLDHREVGAAVAADEGGLRGLAVLELHRDGGGAVDDVVVRDDVALAVEHEAGPSAFADCDCCGPPKEVVAACSAARADDDVDDAGRRALVEVDQRPDVRS